MKRKMIITKLLILWLLLTLYLILHEGGHSLAVLLFGGEINYFNLNLLNAHVSYTGKFTMLEYSIIHLAGFGLPFLLWFIFISLIPVKVENSLIKYIKVYSAIVILSILPWVIIPILNSFGKAPEGDDVTKFLNSSGLNSILASFIFLCLLLISFYIWWKKSKNISKWRQSCNKRNYWLQIRNLSKTYLSLYVMVDKCCLISNSINIHYINAFFNILIEFNLGERWRQSDSKLFLSDVH